jgi:hypothetical protein
VQFRHDRQGRLKPTRTTGTARTAIGNLISPLPIIHELVRWPRGFPGIYFLAFKFNRVISS